MRSFIHTRETHLFFHRFGASLANLGFLDSDRYQDFAVGAPYDGENREGAVYIYRGSINFNFDGNKMREMFCSFTACFNWQIRKVSAKFIWYENVLTFYEYQSILYVLFSHYNLIWHLCLLAGDFYYSFAQIDTVSLVKSHLFRQSSVFIIIINNSLKISYKIPKNNCL